MVVTIVYLTNITDAPISFDSITPDSLVLWFFGSLVLWFFGDYNFN
jgi:hypothetical protein